MDTKLQSFINKTRETSSPFRVNTDNNTLYFGSAKVAKQTLADILYESKCKPSVILSTTVNDVISYCLSNGFTFSKSAEREAQRQQREAEKAAQAVRINEFIAITNRLKGDISKCENEDQLNDISTVIGSLSAYSTVITKKTFEITVQQINTLFRQQQTVVDDIKTYGASLTRDRNNQIQPTVPNIKLLLLAYAKAHGVTFRYNTHSSEFMYGDDPLSAEVYNELQDMLLCRMNNVNLQNVAIAINALCYENKYNPIIERIDNIRETVTWDGKKRCEIFLSTIGLDCDPNTPRGRYNREVTLKTLYALISRIYEDNVPFDHMLIMQSPVKGSGKSTVWVTLLASIGIDVTYYNNVCSINTNNTDNVISYCRAVINNVDECGNVFKKQGDEYENVKSTITTTSFQRRAAYAMKPNIYKAHYIFIGSTNQKHFIGAYDEQSERRAWIVQPEGERHEERSYWDNLWQNEFDLVQLWAELIYYYDNKMIPDFNTLTPASRDEMEKIQISCRVNAESFKEKEDLYNMFVLSFFNCSGNAQMARTDTMVELGRFASCGCLPLNVCMKYELSVISESASVLADKLTPDNVIEVVSDLLNNISDKLYRLPVSELKITAPLVNNIFAKRSVNTITANIADFAYKQDLGSKSLHRYVYAPCRSYAEIIEYKLRTFTADYEAAKKELINLLNTAYIKNSII